MTETEFMDLWKEMLKNKVDSIIIQRIDRDVYKGKDNSLVIITPREDVLIIQWSPSSRFKDLSEIRFFDDGSYEVTMLPMSSEGYKPTLDDLSTFIDTLLNSEEFEIKRNLK